MSLREDIARQRAELAQDRARYARERGTTNELQARLHRERAFLDSLRKHRKALHREIKRELERDLKNQGVHTDEWEERIADKLDEIADEIELTEFQIDAVFARFIDHRDLRKRFAKEIKSDEERLERLIQRRRRRRENNSDQLTKDFHLSEFDCRNGQQVKEGVPQIIPHLEALCKGHLQPLRDSGGVVGVNSGWRPAAYNASIGGAPQSYHIYELRKTAPAADHIQQGRSAGSVQAWHESHNPFDGMGFYSGFTHGDDRGYRARWYGAA